MDIRDNRSFLFKNTADAWHGVRALTCPANSYRRLFNVVFETPDKRRGGVRLADAIDCDFVGMHPGSAINHVLTRAAAELERPLRLRIQVTGYDALCLMVSAGLGVGVMPRGSAQLYRGALPVRVVPLRETWAQRRLSLCVRSGESLSSVARLLVDHLRGPAPEHEEAVA